MDVVPDTNTETPVSVTEAVEIGTAQPVAIREGEAIPVYQTYGPIALNVAIILASAVLINVAWWVLRILSYAPWPEGTSFSDKRTAVAQFRDHVWSRSKVWGKTNRTNFVVRNIGYEVGYNNVPLRPGTRVRCRTVVGGEGTEDYSIDGRTLPMSRFGAWLCFNLQILELPPPRLAPAPTLPPVLRQAPAPTPPPRPAPHVPPQPVPRAAPAPAPAKRGRKKKVEPAKPVSSSWFSRIKDAK